MKELSLFVFGVIAALLIGSSVTYAFFPQVNEVQVVKEVEVPVETVVERNITLIQEVPVDFESYKDKAVLTVLDKLKNNAAFLTCDGDRYDKSEIVQTRVNDGFTYENIDSDYDKYAVTYTARYSFDDGSRNKNVCHETRSYKVTYEENEKAIVALQ